MEPEDTELTRADFDSLEDWLRYRWKAGLGPTDDDDTDYHGVDGEGHFTMLTGALYGHTRREYELAWQLWGETHSVDFADLQRVYNAIALANCRGVILSTRVDISWSTVGITNEISIRAAFKSFLDWMSRWLGRHAGWPAYVYVFERGPRYGIHTHMLVHVPFDLGDEFRSGANRILMNIIGRPLLDTTDSTTMLIQPRGPNVDTQWKRFRYMMKGISPDLPWPRTNATGLNSIVDRVRLKPKPGGVIQGKRVGVSRALDKAAVKRWSAVNEFPDMTIEPWGEYLYGNRFLDWYAKNDLVDPDHPPRNGNG